MDAGKRHAFRGTGPASILKVWMPSRLGDNFFAGQAIGDDGVI